MMHARRIWGEPVEAPSPEALAESLTEHVWTPCTAWRLGPLLFLNDSTSPDGAQEYAVLRDGRQIESITFGWCDQGKALDYIRRLLAGSLAVNLGPVVPRFHARGETCAHCA